MDQTAVHLVPEGGSTHSLQESNGSDSYRFGTGNHRGQEEEA